MPLFHVQDSDRPLWIVAPDWQHAITKWKTVVADENDGDESLEPDGIQRVCDDDELVVFNGIFTPDLIAM